MTDTNKALTEGWLVDTKHLQIRSVVEFAASLGYYFDTLRNSFFFDGHVKDVTFKGCEIISFNTFARLHNTAWVRSKSPNMRFPYPGGVHTCSVGQPLQLECNSPFEIDHYTLVKAQACKIVEQVYINGGQSGVSCYRDLIKFTQSEYYGQFLEPLIDEEGEQ